MLLFVFIIYDKLIRNEFLEVVPVIHLINRQKFDAKVLCVVIINNGKF